MAKMGINEAHEVQVRKELLLLARGISLGSTTDDFDRQTDSQELPQGSIMIHRNRLLEELAQQHIPFTVVHADIYCLESPRKDEKQEYQYTNNIFKYGILHAITNRTIPDSLEVRTKGGVLVSEVSLDEEIFLRSPDTRLLWPNLKQVPSLSFDDLDPRIQRLQVYDKEVYEMHALGSEGNAFKYKLALLLGILEIEKDPVEYINDCLQELGYGARYSGKLVWVEKPKDPIHDANLSLIVSIAPDIFGHAKDQQIFNLADGPEEVSNFCIGDHIYLGAIMDSHDSRRDLGKRTTGAIFSFGDGRYVRDVEKARDILRLVSKNTSLYVHKKN